MKKINSIFHNAVCASTTGLLDEYLLARKTIASEENINGMAMNMETSLNNTLEYSHLNEYHASFNYLKLYTLSTFGNTKADKISLMTSHSHTLFFSGPDTVLLSLITHLACFTDMSPNDSCPLPQI